MVVVVEVKRKVCHHCGEEFKPFSSLAKACSIGCSIELAAKKRRKAFKQETAAKKKKLRSR